MFSTRVSLVAIYLLRLASPVHSLHAKRSIDDAELIARAFEINADAVFPPHHADKRGLAGLLSVVGNGLNTALNDVGGGVNTLLGGAGGATSTVAAVVTTTAANNNNGGNTGATTTAAADNGSGSGNDGNSSANNGSGTTSANNNNNGNSNGNGANTSPSNGSGAASASGSGNSGNGGTVPMDAFVTSGVIGVVTDHSGHTITTTGTAPITLTYVTTLPNGVVSTVTEVITPTAEVFGEPVTTTSSASRIAAIAGSIVALLIVFFIVAFVLLMLRRRRRRIQLTNSRPESSLSFGSEDILNHNHHRDSSEPLEPTGSMTSFRTAPAYVDGQKMDFPLPPVPSADLNHNEMAGTSQRPISVGSDLTNDLMERRSRTSLIAERNFFRKVGQYPDAGSYTPFALAPSSELGHSEEAFDHNNAYEGTSNPREFHENYRRSRTLDFAPSVHENPFNDPAHIAQPAPPVPAASNQRQSGLWRKATFGSSQQPSKRQESHPPSSFAQPHIDTFGRKSSMTSVERGTVVSHASSDYETATESKHSSGGYSYHSAFARYAYTNDPNAENPFADSNVKDPGSPPPSSRLLTSAAGWRPATAGSTASLSIMSSTGNSARELGSTPDPKDIFYHPPSTGQSARPSTAASQPPRPWSADSARPSEDNQTEETVRQKNIAYPSLHGVVQQMQARR